MARNRIRCPRLSVQLLLVAAVSLASLHLASGKGVEQVLKEEEFEQIFRQSSDYNQRASSRGGVSSGNGVNGAKETMRLTRLLVGSI